MKKFSFLFASVAIVALGVLSVSCTRTDDPVAPTASAGVINETSYTLQVSTNVSATVTLNDGQSKTGTDLEFTLSKSSVDYTVTATGYITQEGSIDFSDEQKVTAIAVELVKPSTLTMSQAEVAASTKETETVTNDATNSAAVVPVSIEIPTDVTITGTTDPFSITAVPAAPETLSPETLEAASVDVINQTALQLVCEPDGAVFDKPVTLKATIPGSAGLKFNVLGAEKVTQDGNVISFDVTHFSTWYLDLDVTINSITTDSVEVLNTSRLVETGQQTITFTKNIGSESNISNEYLQNFLDNTFGLYSKEETSVSFSVSGSGSATVVVRQGYRDFNLTCGNYTFTVRVWGGCVPHITTTIDTSSHSGGVAQ